MAANFVGIVSTAAVWSQMAYHPQQMTKHLDVLVGLALAPSDRPTSWQMTNHSQVAANPLAIVHKTAVGWQMTPRPRQQAMRLDVLMDIPLGPSDRPTSWQLTNHSPVAAIFLAIVHHPVALAPCGPPQMELEVLRPRLDF